MNPLDQFLKELNLIVSKIESQAVIIDVLCKEAHSVVEKAIAYYEELEADDEA